jgi:hypothetical protein
MCLYNNIINASLFKCRRSKDDQPLLGEGEESVNAPDDEEGARPNVIH